MAKKKHKAAAKSGNRLRHFQVKPETVRYLKEDLGMTFSAGQLGYVLAKINRARRDIVRDEGWDALDTKAELHGMIDAVLEDLDIPVYEHG